MKDLLRLEEMAQFALCLAVLVMNDVPWWAYVLLVIGPDISMLGYLAGPRIGAFSYNLFHHKGVAIAVAVVSFGAEAANMLSASGDVASAFLLGGIILYGHASMDRIFGYGLKFGDSFHHTHLGWIGKGAALQEKE
ncbi:MAG: DUF4260 domain-containing protein [Flavobacteriales bacterium]|nr:DUF4260 domain-containing protein [Flavobacteriales bacterium]